MGDAPQSQLPCGRARHAGGGDGRLGYDAVDLVVDRSPFGMPDQVGPASEVYGIRGFRAETPEQLEAAAASEGPRFRDVAVESIADRLPPVFSRRKRAGVGVPAAF